MFVAFQSRTIGAHHGGSGPCGPVAVAFVAFDVRPGLGSQIDGSLQKRRWPAHYHRAEASKSPRLRLRRLRLVWIWETRFFKFLSAFSFHRLRLVFQISAVCRAKTAFSFRRPTRKRSMPRKFCFKTENWKIADLQNPVSLFYVFRVPGRPPSGAQNPKDMPRLS